MRGKVGMGETGMASFMIKGGLTMPVSGIAGEFHTQDNMHGYAYRQAISNINFPD